MRIAFDIDGVIITENIIHAMKDYASELGKWRIDQKDTKAFKQMFSGVRRKFFRLIRENLDKLLPDIVKYAREKNIKTIEVASYSARQDAMIDSMNIFKRASIIWGEGRFDFDLIVLPMVTRLFSVTTLLEYSMIYLHTMLPKGVQTKLAKSMLLDHVAYGDKNLKSLVRYTKLPILAMHLSKNPGVLWVVEDRPEFITEITDENVLRSPGGKCTIVCTHVKPEGNKQKVIKKQNCNKQTMFDYCQSNFSVFRPKPPETDNTWADMQSFYR